MLWILGLILLILLVISFIYHIKGIIIRFFGFELTRVLICLVVLALVIGEIILPMPSYYIKHQSGNSTDGRPTFNQILEGEVQKAGIRYDEGSFKIMDSRGMNFNHLFLGSYQIDGQEEARVFHFEKNIFGNMRPKYSFDEAPIISKDNSYRTTVQDGVFGIYMVTVGFASEEKVLRKYILNNFRVDETHQNNYFMWVDLIRQPWKSLVLAIMVSVFFSMIGDFIRRDRKPIKFYCRWQKGSRIFQCVKGN